MNLLEVLSERQVQVFKNYFFRFYSTIVNLTMFEKNMYATMALMYPHLLG